MSQIIELLEGDITNCKVDAIVNAANSRLAGGGGVDGAIHKAAGPKLLQACQKIYKEQGECPAGSAVLTPAYNLPAKYVIHAVGPIWSGGAQQEEEKLSHTYLKCLELALEHTCKSIAFPNISTGVYHFPSKRAAEIVLNTLMDFLTQRKKADFTQILLICFDKVNYDIYDTLLKNKNSSILWN